MIKKNIKVISIFILGVICALGITISAYVITGKKVLVKVNGWNVKNAEEAVNYLKDENSCPGLTPKLANVTSGDINTVGSVVQIGDEEFYVIGQGSGQEEGYTKLLTKSSLKNNNQVSSGGEEVYFSSNQYWYGKVGTGLQYPGTYNHGNPYPYVYDSNNGLYLKINNYADKIENVGFSSVKSRLLSYEEANSLPADVIKSVGTPRYWTGSLYGESIVWVVTGSGTLDWVSYTIYNQNVNGIRPVILILTNEIG